MKKYLEAMVGAFYLSLCVISVVAFTFVITTLFMSEIWPVILWLYSDYPYHSWGFTTLFAIMMITFTILLAED